MIVDKINKFLSDEKLTLAEAVRYEVEKLAGFAFKRQFLDEREDKPYTLRLSSSGKCARQLAYKYHGYPVNGKELDSRSKIIFFQGDLVETMIVSLAKISGCKILGTGFNQVNVQSEVEENQITGHPDGILINKGIWLVEVKSMSSFGFDRFTKGEVDISYRVQINMYMDALGLDRCVMVAMNKDSGVLGELIFNKDDKLVKIGKENLKKVIKSEKSKLPSRPYSPDSKGFYPWMCAYCSHYNTCLVETRLAEKVLVRNKYKIKAVKNESNS